METELKEALIQQHHKSPIQKLGLVLFAGLLIVGLATYNTEP
jgi:hypothetical protein